MQSPQTQDPDVHNFVVCATDGAHVDVIAVFRRAKDAEAFVKMERMLPRHSHIGIVVAGSKLDLWGSLTEVLARERAEELAKQKKIIS